MEICHTHGEEKTDIVVTNVSSDTVAKYVFRNNCDVILVSFSPENLKELRKDKNLTQAELSDVSGVSQQSISFYESGSTSPTDEALRKLGKALKVIFVSDWQDEDWEKETSRFRKKQG